MAPRRQDSRAFICVLCMSAIAVGCLTRQLGHHGAVLLSAEDETAGGVHVKLSDLVSQNPIWAPETEEPVSKGFNAWMDTLPFGESMHHRRLREDWELRHSNAPVRSNTRSADGSDSNAVRPALQLLAPVAKASQTQMLRLQQLVPNVWTDYTIGGAGVKCVCDSAAAGDPEMEGIDPNVRPACTCSGGRTTRFTKTEEGGPLDTGGHGAWPQDLPGAAGGGDGAAYIDGIVGNNAYKPAGDVTILAALRRVDDDNEYNVYGDDYRSIPSGQRQRGFDAAYDDKNNFKYHGAGLFPDEPHQVAPPMSGLWGSPPIEDTYEWSPSVLPGNGIAAHENAARKARVQQQGTAIASLKKSLNEARKHDLTHPDTIGGTFGHARDGVLGRHSHFEHPGYGDPHTSRLED